MLNPAKERKDLNAASSYGNQVWRIEVGTPRQCRKYQFSKSRVLPDDFSLNSFLQPSLPPPHLPPNLPSHVVSFGDCRIVNLVEKTGRVAQENVTEL